MLVNNLKIEEHKELKEAAKPIIEQLRHHAPDVDLEGVIYRYSDVPGYAGRASYFKECPGMPIIVSIDQRLSSSKLSNERSEIIGHELCHTVALKKSGDGEHSDYWASLMIHIGLEPSVYARKEVSERMYIVEEEFRDAFVKKAREYAFKSKVLALLRRKSSG